MKHGRIVRVTPYRGTSQIFYVVAEEDRVMAARIIRRHIDHPAAIECIGRASLQLLVEMSLTEGQFQRSEP
jgi:hypothetical protein